MLTTSQALQGKEKKRKKKTRKKVRNVFIFHTPINQFLHTIIWKKPVSKSWRNGQNKSSVLSTLYGVFRSFYVFPASLAKQQKSNKSTKYICVSLWEVKCCTSSSHLMIYSINWKGKQVEKYKKVNINCPNIYICGPL